MKNIVLLTTTHLSRNPRLVKEIDTLSKHYSLDVFFFEYLLTFSRYDKDIVNSYPDVRFHAFSWRSRLNAQRLAFTLISKVLQIIYQFSKIDLLPEQRLFAGFLPLKNKAVKIKATSYHAHNIGALAAGVKAAKKNAGFAIFDAEDYHRGELLEGDAKSQLIIKLESKYIPLLDLLTTASPISNRMYLKHFPQTKTLCINNVFSVKDSNPPSDSSLTSLRLVWFSQDVGTDRGLEDIIAGINCLKDKHSITFDIYGAADETIQTFFRGLINYKSLKLNFRGVVDPGELERSLTSYDVGIASETGYTLNRKYCLTNKIFSYMKAGNAILASATPAQKEFLNGITPVGLIYESGNSEQIALNLSKWLLDPQLIRTHRLNSYNEFLNTYNWEVESRLLLRELAIITQQSEQPVVTD